MPIDHFSLIAGLYDRVGQFNMTEPMLGLLSLSPGCRLLDVGGGTGRVAVAMRDLVHKVFVVDVSEGMLRRALGKDLPVICAPAESLPFPSGSFDRIVMMDALHHVADQRETARELWRILAKDGLILIVEPDIHKISVKGIAIGEKLLLMRSHFLAGEQITALFTDLGAKCSAVFEKSNVFLKAEK